MTEPMPTTEELPPILTTEFLSYRAAIAEGGYEIDPCVHPSSDKPDPLTFLQVDAPLEITTKVADLHEFERPDCSTYWRYCLREEATP